MEKTRSLLILPTPEMVKARTLIALRRRQMEKTVQRNSGHYSLAKKPETLKDRSSGSIVRKSPQAVVKVPWLGVGFHKLQEATASPDLQEDEQKDSLPPVVSTESKDVQVSFIPEITGRLAVRVKTVELDCLPLDQSTTTKFIDFQAFIEACRKKKKARKLQQPQTREDSEHSWAGELNNSASDVGVYKEAEESLAKPVIRKTLTRPSPGIAPPANFTLEMESAPRVKSSFSCSRVRKSTAVRRLRETFPTLPFPPLDTTNTSIECNKPHTQATRHRSFPLFSNIRKSTLPPHRLPVEYNLFRKVKKSSLARHNCNNGS